MTHDHYATEADRVGPVEPDHVLHIGIDGPSLRSLRESRGIPVRRVARAGGMTHGHLSKVERGEVGRPVTPAVLRAYEEACGVPLMTEPAGTGNPGGWRPGQLADRARRHFMGSVASMSVGGNLLNTPGRLLDGRGRLPLHQAFSAADLEDLDRAAEALAATTGQGAGRMAWAALRWLVDARVAEDATRVSLLVSARLARRAAQSAIEVGAHDSARTLLIVGLHAAALADEPNTRAHVLGDIAQHLLDLNHLLEAQQAARLGLTDERMSAGARARLRTIREQASHEAKSLAEWVQRAAEQLRVESDDDVPTTEAERREQNELDEARDEALAQRLSLNPPA